MTTLTIQLEQLEHAQLVRPLLEEELAYQFKHALTQEAAYTSLLVRNRRGIHRHVAEAYERLYPEQLGEFASVLAEHYAAAGDDAKTVEYAIRAGDRDKNINAQPEARRLYGQALELLGRLPDNAETRRRRMETLASQVWVSSFLDPPRVNLARLDEAEGLAKELAASDPALQRQIALIYDGKGFIYQLLNEPRQAQYYFNKARTLAQTLGDEVLLALATIYVGLQLFMQGRFGDSTPTEEICESKKRTQMSQRGGTSGRGTRR